MLGLEGIRALNGAGLREQRSLRMSMNSTDIPEGFEPHFRKSPFTDPWEPLYSKRTDKAVIIGLRRAT
jgi:hypothetical protein